MGHQLQLELQMRGLTDAALLDCLIGNLNRYYGILALNDREVVHLTQVEHLIHEFRDAFAVFYDLMIDRLQILTAELDIRGCQHLGETRVNFDFILADSSAFSLAIRSSRLVASNL